jgi:hypothetical protein
MVVDARLLGSPDGVVHAAADAQLSRSPPAFCRRLLRQQRRNIFRELIVPLGF